MTLRGIIMGPGEKKLTDEELEEQEELLEIVLNEEDASHLFGGGLFLYAGRTDG